MDAENPVVDDHAERQKIKHVGEVMPDTSVAVLAGTFSVEAIRLRDAARLVIPSNQMHALGVSQLQTHEQGDCLYAEETSINVVPCPDISIMTSKLLLPTTNQGRGNWYQGRIPQS